MILDRGPITLEFFLVAVDPRTTTGSACLRVDDLDALHAAFGVVGNCRASAGRRPACCLSRRLTACGCSCLSIRTAISCAASTISMTQADQPRAQLPAAAPNTANIAHALTKFFSASSRVLTELD